MPKLARDAQGNNVLTDFWEIRIPLFWPDWDLPEVEHLLCLKTWSEGSYEAFIHFLEGKFVESLEDLLAPERVEVERLPDEVKHRESRVDRDRNGQCYHDAYKSITVVGPYFIFTVEHQGIEFYILDSPFYGIALRAFWRKQDARDYAQGPGPAPISFPAYQAIPYCSR